MGLLNKLDVTGNRKRIKVALRFLSWATKLKGLPWTEIGNYREKCHEFLDPIGNPTNLSCSYFNFLPTWLRGNGSEIPSTYPSLLWGLYVLNHIIFKAKNIPCPSYWKFSHGHHSSLRSLALVLWEVMFVLFSSLYVNLLLALNSALTRFSEISGNASIDRSLVNNQFVYPFCCI